MQKNAKLNFLKISYFSKRFFFFFCENLRSKSLHNIENKIEYDCRFLHEQEDIAYSFLGINFVRWKLNQLISKRRKNGTQKLYESC